MAEQTSSGRNVAPKGAARPLKGSACASEAGWPDGSEALLSICTVRFLNATRAERLACTGSADDA